MRTDLISLTKGGTMHMGRQKTSAVSSFWNSVIRSKVTNTQRKR